MDTSGTLETAPHIPLQAQPRALLPQLLQEQNLPQDPSRDTSSLSPAAAISQLLSPFSTPPPGKRVRQLGLHDDDDRDGRPLPPRRGANTAHVPKAVEHVGTITCHLHACRSFINAFIFQQSNAQVVEETGMKVRVVPSGALEDKLRLQSRKIQVLQAELRSERQRKSQLHQGEAEWSIRMEAVNEQARSMQQRYAQRDNHHQQYISTLESRLEKGKVKAEDEGWISDLEDYEDYYKSEDEEGDGEDTKMRDGATGESDVSYGAYILCHGINTILQLWIKVKDEEMDSPAALSGSASQGAAAPTRRRSKTFTGRRPTIPAPVSCTCMRVPDSRLTIELF